MCLINCNIEVEEKKEKKRNLDITYEWTLHKYSKKVTKTIAYSVKIL